MHPTPLCPNARPLRRPAAAATHQRPASPPPAARQVYANHVEPLKLQLANAPRHLPTLRINPAKTDIDAFVFEDFEVLGYAPHRKIEMQMAV